jgi:hypothetical protein
MIPEPEPPPANDPRWGARFSALDTIVLVAAGIGIALARDLPIVPGAMGIVVGHFLLFCNVVRMRRALELIWAIAFLGVALGLPLLFREFRAEATLLAIAPLTAVLVAIEVRSARYHGLLARRLNPRLGTWLAAQPPLRRR